MNNNVSTTEFTAEQKHVLNRMWRKMQKVAKRGVRFHSWSINLRSGEAGRVELYSPHNSTCAFGALLLGQPNKYFESGTSMGTLGAKLLGIDEANSLSVETGFMGENENSWHKVGQELRKRAEKAGYYVISS